MEDFEKKLSEALMRVGFLEGVSCARCEDSEIGIRAGHLNDYMTVINMAKLLEDGKLKIGIAPSEIPYFYKLLNIK